MLRVFYSHPDGVSTTRISPSLGVLIDTGADRSTISSTMAATLGLVPCGHIMVRNATSTSRRELVSVRIQDIVTGYFIDLTVSVRDSTRLPHPILGRDYCSAVGMVISFAARPTPLHRSNFTLEDQSTPSNSDSLMSSSSSVSPPQNLSSSSSSALHRGSSHTPLGSFQLQERSLPDFPAYGPWLQYTFDPSHLPPASLTSLATPTAPISIAPWLPPTVLADDTLFPSTITPPPAPAPPSPPPPAVLATSTSHTSSSRRSCPYRSSSATG